ncbi:MAG TPA: hypothetical protein VMF08_14150 [Candidatus Sulfotelmatobacter sp.]|nr:hypothetical protein [Candidatus Sulfotelmatobacter sp.]
MAKTLNFRLKFEDTAPSRITYKVTGREKAAVAVESEISVLYINKDASKLMAEIFAKLAMGSYPDGFHIHLV